MAVKKDFDLSKPVVEIPAGSTLYHGTVERFDARKPRTGGYDNVFWTTISPRVARSYIPVKPSYSSPSSEDIMFDKHYEKLRTFLGIKDTTATMIRRIAKRVNKEFDDAYGTVIEKKRLADKLEKNLSDPAVYGNTTEFEKVMTALDDVIREWGAAEDKQRSAKRISDDDLIASYVALKMKPFGYIPSRRDKYGVFRNVWFDYKDGTLHHADERANGRVLMVRPNRTLRLFNAAMGRDEGDLMNPDHNRHSWFRTAEEKGYDGIVIHDFAQTDTYGNMGHVSYGLFQKTLGDVTVRSVRNQTHPRDEEWKTQEESKKTTFDECFLEAERNGDITDTPAFKKWFGDSKIVDANGRPLVVYHGSRGDKINVFVGRSSRNSRYPEEIGTIFFTDDKQMAMGYGRNVMEVYLSFQNPLIYNADGRSYISANWEALQEAKKQNKDSVIILNVDDTSAGNSARLINTYIAFSPSQIKSATGNNGNFDPEKTNINEDDSQTREQEEFTRLMIAKAELKAKANEQIKSDQFQQWFKGSRVVDQQGRPKIVYHGTNTSGFTKFESHRGMNIFDRLGSFWGEKKIAEKRASQKFTYRGGEKYIYEAYLCIKKPLYVYSWGAFFKLLGNDVFFTKERLRDFYNHIKEIDDKSAKYKHTDRPLTEIVLSERELDLYFTDASFREDKNITLLREADEYIDNGLMQKKLDSVLSGYDGICIENDEGYPNTWIAFKPNQVKSATGTNNGNFDLNSEDINESTFEYYFSKAKRSIT